MDAADGAVLADRDLSRATLDTLPINVAVLDEDGDIIFTNQAWRSYAGGDPTRPPPEETGVNYLDAIDPTVDGFAQRALDGLLAVRDGEREQFTLEYPCHSPDERHWFLMQVSSFVEAGDTRLVVAHSDITERKLAELQAARNAAEVRQERRNLEALLARINGLLEDITEGLVGQTTREGVDRLVCERLVRSDPYAMAWIAERDLAADRLVVREAAGVTEAAPTHIDLDAEDIAVEAVDATEPVVLDLREDERPDWLPEDVRPRIGALAAFPLAIRDVSYGVLVIGAVHASAFNERELAVLSALAHSTASTINAIEGRRILTTTAVIELEFVVSDPTFPLLDLAGRAGCPISVQGSVSRDDGSLLLYLAAATDDGDGALEAARSLPSVDEATVLTEHEGEVLLELSVTESVVTTIAEFGGVMTTMSAGDGEARITVELPYEADARAVYGMLTERYPGTELIAYREQERPAQTRQGMKGVIDERLTERQRTALRSAYLAGYFEWPRPVDGDDLSAAMGISRPTFHQHLRAAERKVMDALYGAES